MYNGAKLYDMMWFLLLNKKENQKYLFIKMTDLQSKKVNEQESQKLH